MQKEGGKKEKKKKEFYFSSLSLGSISDSFSSVPQWWVSKQWKEVFIVTSIPFSLKQN